MANAKLSMSGAIRDRSTGRSKKESIVMNPTVRFLAAGVASICLLAGCGKSEKSPEGGNPEDPAVSGALGDQIMVDPELAGQSGAAVSAGSASIELPPEQRSPEAIAAARQEAAKLAGGTLKSVSSPTEGKVTSLLENAATAAQIAQASKAAATDCASMVKYSMTWATKLPTALKVYPRGAVQEAAGIDNGDCSLRVISFATPVSTGDVMDFYYTRATADGYNADYHIEGADHVLGGSKGAAAFVIYARKLDNGLTEVDLISSGK